MLRTAPAQTNIPIALQWPPITRQTHPWTRWWWLGSAVDKPNLTRLLETYQQAGLGGVEITPIYGVQGQEAREIPYLSPQWVEMLRYTIDEAHRLDMGVDMPTGTGWPFGGPTVSEADAEDKLVIKTTRLTAGQTVTLDLAKEQAQAPVAVSQQGETVHLLDKADAQGHVSWPVPDGAWTLYIVTQRWAGQNVKRAAPGGRGKVIDPFSKEAVTHYLEWFDKPLAALPKGALRAHFHDSFEYRADWAATVFTEFRARRGYDLRDHLPALAGNASEDENARVRTDYRETMADMLLADFTQTWTDWAHRQGSLSRNQAHGSPGNLLDLYGTVDIPETEVFRHIGDPRMSKFASSAAHVMGHPLASSESCTWMSEHFTETLAQAKVVLDRLLVAGINHIFYHGTAYSPADAAWPGWLFYASTHFEPNNTIWHDFPTLNAYVTRCQSVLQAGQPDNDILLYWPLHDMWQQHPRLFGLSIEGQWFTPEPIAHTAQSLLDRGYSYDYISDHQLTIAKATPQGIQVPGGPYQVILVPPCQYIPLPTLRTLLDLARNGATVIFQDGLPADVPGLADLANRRQAMNALLAPLKGSVADQSGMRQIRQGAGRIFIGADLNAMLAAARVRREPLADHQGLMFIRRTYPGGHHYFITNQGDTALDGWVELGTTARAAAILDPMSGHAGIAHVRHTAGGQAQVYMQLASGESTILRTLAGATAGPSWPYYEPAGAAVPLTGTWHVTFLEGGPALPQSFTTNRLASWTELGDEEAKRFAGTARYTLQFDAPATASEWMLDLGQVRESARVRLNGHDIGTVIANPFQIQLGELKKSGNVLEIDVTNVTANRIRDLDRRKVPWKIMDEINFVNIDYKPFDASNWPLHDSGLIGPVRLVPLRATKSERG